MGLEGRREETPNRRTSGPESPRNRSPRERSRPRPAVILKPRDPYLAPEAPSEKDDQRERSPPPPKAPPASPASPRREERTGSPQPLPRPELRREDERPPKGQSKGKSPKGKSKGWSRSSKGKGKSTWTEKTPPPTDKRVQFLEEPELPSRVRSPTPPAGRKSTKSGILKASQYSSTEEKREQEKNPPSKEEVEPVPQEPRPAKEQSPQITVERDPGDLRRARKGKGKGKFVPWYIRQRKYKQKLRDQTYEARPHARPRDH